MGIKEQLLAQKGLLTTKEVAELINAHPATIVDWVHRGILTATRLGHEFRFDPWTLAYELDYVHKTSSATRRVYILRPNLNLDELISELGTGPYEVEVRYRNTLLVIRGVGMFFVPERFLEPDLCKVGLPSRGKE